MSNEEHRDRLETLFGGYFHQDWDLKGSTWQEVMNAYMRETPSRAELKVLRSPCESSRAYAAMKN
jgi:hypothetical protein